jgi:hypothetical protein
MMKTFQIEFMLSPCKHYMLFDNTYWDKLCDQNDTFLTKKSKYMDERSKDLINEYY